MEVLTLKSPLIMSLSCFLLSFSFFSCSVNQQITLKADGSGHVSSSVYLEDFFIATLQDLTDLRNSGAGGTDRLAPETVQQELKMNPYFSNVSVQMPRKGEYKGSLSFSHIEDLFSMPGTIPSENILQYKELKQGVYQLTIKINKKNFSQIFQLFPMLQDPGFQYFLPEESISEAEYKEALYFIFQDTGGIREQTLKSLINGASLDLLIQVEGSIIDQKGGQMLNSSTMRISIPLIKLLLHKEDINYSLTYRAR